MERTASMKKYRVYFFFGVLLLASPVLHAQDFLQKAKNYLDAGECGKAQRAYNAYKVENPEGNVEVEKGIVECKDAHTLKRTTLNMDEGEYEGEVINGQPQGQGIMTWTYGEYVGNWVNDERDGSFVRTKPS